MGKMKDTTIPDYDQHSHDPMCPQYDCWLEGCTVCDECALIARVREDEKERILQAAYESAPAQVRQDEVARIYNIGYMEAISNAVKAVEVLHKDDKSLRKVSGKKYVDEDYYWALDDTIAAIEALKGKV